MKKPFNAEDVIQYTFKLSLKMKLTVLLTVVSLLQIHANSYSQSKKISLDMGNVTVKEVLNKIESVSEFKFLFNRKDVDLNRKVSIKVTKKPITDILMELFAGTDVGFEVLDKQIILSKSIKKAVPNNTIDFSHIGLKPQQFSVSGSVTDKQGMPLPGANIVEKGTTNGVTADFDGNFSIEVADGNTVLEISYIGFATKNVAVNGQSNIAITLAESAAALDEIVVVGYGTQKKSDLTGSVGSIDADEISSQPVSSLDQALQGRVSGVHITQSSNAPGGGLTIRIRGGNSISASNDPLFVVDGFPIARTSLPGGAINSTTFSNPLASINPNDIESIEVLKDASATAIYGSRGANGVILVTTKKGIKGESNIDFEFYQGLQQVTNTLDMVTAEEHTSLKNEQLRNLGYADRYGDPNGQYPKAPAEYGKGTDWQKEIFRAAPIQNYQLTFSGGNDKIRYLISGNYFNQDGIVISTNFKRYSSRINLDATLNERLKVGTNFTISRNINNAINEVGTNGVVGAALSRSPASNVFDENGDYTLLNVGSGSGFGSFPNPVALAKTSTNQLKSNRVLGNIYGDFTIMDDLVARISIGADILDSKRNVFYTPETLVGNNVNGYGSIGTSSNINLLNENTLSYSNTFGENSIDALVGFTFQNNQEERTYSQAQDFPNYTLGANNLGMANQPLPTTNSVGEWGLNSYLARINYRYKERYLLTLTGRIDGSSRFGVNNKYGTFPSGALGWRISQEDFLKNSITISNLKLRTSYGLTGNDGIGLYKSLSEYKTARTVFGDQEVLTNQASRIANPELKWEKTKQFDVGLDLGIFNDRISLTADYYVKTTSDLLLDVQLPATTGFTMVTRNVGSMENKGIELSFNSINFTGEFNWTMNGNFSYNKNRVLSLNNADQFLVSSSGGSVASIIKVGVPLGSFYGNVRNGIWQTEDEIKAAGEIARAGDLPGAIRYKDLNGDGIFNEATDRQILGNGIPDFIFGLTNSFLYKGLDLSIFIQGVQGNKIFNRTRREIEQGDPSSAQLKTVYYNAWRVDEPSTVLPSIRQWRATNTDSFYIENGSFIRIKNITLGYKIPVKSSFIKKSRIYLSGQNLITFTQYRGYDPEVNSDFDSNTSYGIDNFAYPAARTITLGANLSF